MPADGSLTVSILAPSERHDAILLAQVAPLVRELGTSPLLDSIYFERVNKPEWGIRLRILGERAWLDSEVRGLVERRAGSVAGRAAFVDDDAEDKWVGGLREHERLKGIYHLDTVACLDLMETEASGGLGTSRAQWSLLVVEELLDLFELRDAERLEFYRRGFQWAFDLGRWGADVLSVLEEKYEAQRGALGAALDRGDGGLAVDAWGGPDPARIASAFLESARKPIAALVAAGGAQELGRSPMDFAGFVVHAHSNRLGIHATQEAAVRYLVRRAHGGPRPPGP